MEERLQPYVARKLRNAIDRVHSGASRHEGLYIAYNESLQWLEDLDRLPTDVGHVLAKYRGGPVRLPVKARTAHARKRIAAMSEADVRALVDSLETAAQVLLTRAAGTSTAHPG